MPLYVYSTRNIPSKDREKMEYYVHVFANNIYIFFSLLPVCNAKTEALTNNHWWNGLKSIEQNNCCTFSFLYMCNSFKRRKLEIFLILLTKNVHFKNSLKITQISFLTNLEPIIFSITGLSEIQSIIINCYRMLDYKYALRNM